MEKITEKITVIIPVYNAEKYLAPCLDSIIYQTYVNLEILLIDDGSTDESRIICDQYAEKDSRIRVIHKDNEGVSAARNQGIQEASGNYICFMDADDLADAAMLEILYHGMQKKEKSISCCCYQEFSDQIGEWYGKTGKHSGNFREYTPEKALTFLNDRRNKNGLVFIVPWAKLYSKELWDGIQYPLGVRHEDEFVAHHILAAADQVYFTEDEMYYYRQHAQSFMRNEQAKPSDHLVLLDAMEDRIDFYGSHPVLQKGKLVDETIHALLFECNNFYKDYSDPTRAEYRDIRKYITKRYRKLYIKYFRSLGKKEKLGGGLFSFFPLLYYRMAMMKKTISQKRKM